MASNEFSSLTDAQLNTLAIHMNTVLGGGAVYGVPAGDLTTLDTRQTDFTSVLASVAGAKAALRGWVQGKEVDRDELIEIIATIANIVYNNPSVTPQMIADLGLQPRDTTRTKIIPQTPQSLLTTPFASGDVLLKWSRGTNKYGVVYVVETQEEGGEWTQVYSTTRTRITLNGYTPGVTTWFRVKATKNGLTSTASNESPIYHSTGGVTLSLAA